MPGSGSGERSSKSSGRGSGGSGKSVNKPGRPRRTGKRKEPDGPSASAVIDLTGEQEPRLRREASAAANRQVDTIIDLVGPPPQKKGGRRNRDLSDTYLISAHGCVGRKTRTVPPGYSLVFASQVGSASSTVLDELMLSTEDVNRMLVGRYTPRTNRMALERYDAGHKYPDTMLSDEDGDGWLSGVWQLPLKPANFKKVQFGSEAWGDVDDDGEPVRTASGKEVVGVQLMRNRWQLRSGALRSLKTGSERHPDRRWLSQLLPTLPPGKYIVAACREFSPHVTDDRRLSHMVLEGERQKRKLTGARSDPGSLSDTDITRPLPTRLSEQSLDKRMARRYENTAPFDHRFTEPPVAEVSRHQSRGVKGRRGPKAGPAGPASSRQ